MAIQVQNMPLSQRRIRRPQHTFQLRTRPWQIQPFVIAPVLPGETMRNLLLQSRVVTDPLRHPLVGWWKEYYFFYVKHRDLAIREYTTNMVLQPGYDVATATGENASAANPINYKYANTIDWSQHCLQRVVEEYFRFEDEAWNDFMLFGLPAAQIGVQNWMDSIQTAEQYDPVIDDPDTRAPVTASPSNHVKASHIEEAMRQYEWLRLNNLTDMSYDQFVATYGVRIQTEEEHKPELIRYVRDWTYPTNHVDPETGVPSSACSWTMTERADKDRFFNEPGFIFGVTVTRPKVYFAKQKGGAVGMLRDAVAWLPAILQDQVDASYRKVAAGVGPLGGLGSSDYYVDIRDLYLYGDQFLNFEPEQSDDAADAANKARYSGVTLPIGSSGTPDTVDRRYASELDALNLFAGQWETEEESEPEFPTDYDYNSDGLIREDGVVTIMIAGRQVDASAAMP